MEVSTCGIIRAYRHIYKLYFWYRFRPIPGPASLVALLTRSTVTTSDVIDGKEWDGVRGSYTVTRTWNARGKRAKSRSHLARPAW